MPLAESLEQRRMFSAVRRRRATWSLRAPAPLAAAADVTGPRLIGFRMIGSPYGITGIRLMFDEPLDPARVPPCQLRPPRRVHQPRPGSERTVDDDGDFSTDIGDDRHVDEIGLAGVNYDDAGRTVTLSRGRGFLLSHLRTLHIRSGPDGLRDAAGNFLDGDGDGQAGGVGVLRVRTKWGRKVNYFDADGDRVKLRLRGPGRPFVFRHTPSGGEGRRSGDAVQVWLAEPSTPQTVLSGTVTPSQRGGNGSTAIGEILSVEEARIDLLGNPSFQVGTVIP